MSNNTLAKTNSAAVIGNFTQSELDTLKQTIARGTTNEQFSLFVQTCVNSGLNPFLNHVHCIVYNGKSGPTMSIQIAVEGITYLARKTEGYKGIEAQLVHENDEFRMGRDPETGKTVIKEHDWGPSRGAVLGGYAIAKREGFDDVIVYMEVDEIEHMKKGRNADMWKTWFNDMFKKHIIKRAAKLQYGVEIAEDEPVTSPGIDNVTGYEPRERKDITPQQESINQSEQPEHQEEQQPDPIQAAKDEMQVKFAQLGIEGKEAKGEYIKKHLPNASNPPTLQELKGLIEIMDMHIDLNQAQSDDELPV
ncbi:RecT family recombinase [Halalkalibacter oceani]|uniref:RecT family recombinase n=1 Tax=Halalkalibacter oceani TaxID=1653776 RepID=UPI0033910AAB